MPRTMAVVGDCWSAVGVTSGTGSQFVGGLDPWVFSVVIRAQGLSCPVTYSVSLNPFDEETILWQNTCYEFEEGGEHFFDWVVDGESVTGVELHLFKQSLLAPRHYYEAMPCMSWDNSFPTLWFSQARSGKPKGDPDWESFFYRSEDSDWIVVLGTNFLSEVEVEVLRYIMRGA